LTTQIQFASIIWRLSIVSQKLPKESNNNLYFWKIKNFFFILVEEGANVKQKVNNFKKSFLSENCVKKETESGLSIPTFVDWKAQSSKKSFFQPKRTKKNSTKKSIFLSFGLYKKPVSATFLLKWNLKQEKKSDILICCSISNLCFTFWCQKERKILFFSF
jgi:hypothetical protein